MFIAGSINQTGFGSLVLRMFFLFFFCRRTLQLLFEITSDWLFLNRWVIFFPLFRQSCISPLCGVNSGCSCKERLTQTYNSCICFFFFVFFCVIVIKSSGVVNVTTAARIVPNHALRNTSQEEHRSLEHIFCLVLWQTTFLRFGCFFYMLSIK